jgi:hypothetical protein
MKKLSTLWMGAVLMILLNSCSNDGDVWTGGGVAIDSPRALYAIVKPEETQLIDIMPNDYAITLDNIIAVNPETGEFKMKDTEKIDSKAYPIPTQYVIQFYSGDSFLFEAKLNSSLSSYLPRGLTFCHGLTDKNGVARYDLVAMRLINQDGIIEEGYLTNQQEQGIKRMYEILQQAGKIKANIDYDFSF